MPTAVTDLAVWLDALAGSHDRLADLVCELDDAGLRGKSYCAEWTIAQVLSHLGSGAEILGKRVDAVVAGEEPPSRETYPQIWARWDAMGAREVTEEALSTDGHLVEKLEHLGDTLEQLEFTLFGGMRMDAVGLLRMRLGEHAVHTWDIAVALDPRARVDNAAVELLVDGLARAMAWLAKPASAGIAKPFSVRVVISEPDRTFDLEVTDTVTMTLVSDGDGSPTGAADATRTGVGAERAAGNAPALHLPAEAFLRLVYGRLDPSHAPAIDGQEHATLDILRTVFPGF
jgi:uncharacterized protein (TIGR03083 family)